MTENETTSGGAKRRVVALATAGASVAALAVGGFALAGAANAAPGTVTVSLAARSAIFNQTTDPNSGNASVANQQPVQITVTNTGDATTGTNLVFAITGLPSSVPCGNVTLTGTGVNGAGGTPPALVSTSTTPTAASGGSCYFQLVGYSAPAGTSTAPSSNTYDYTETIDGRGVGAPAGTAALTGSLTQQASITATGATAITSNSVSTALSAGTAPKSTGTTVTGTYYGGLNKQVITPGVPIGTVTVTDQSTTTPQPAGGVTCQPGQLGEGLTGYCYSLQNYSTPSAQTTDVFYNAITGSVYYYNPTNAAVAAATDIYQIGESNGYGIAVATANAARTFTDVSTSNPFAKAIYSLVNSGIIQGYADNTFQPAAPVSRQAFAHYIYTALGYKDGYCEPGATPFTDVSYTSPFCESITFLNSVNILNGYSNSIFNPSRDITRQAVAAIVFRYYNYAVTKSVAGGDAACTSPTGFNDVKTSNQFCGDIEWMVKNGYAKGYSDGGYHPAQSTSRQAAAQLLYNIIAGINNGTYPSAPAAALKVKS